MDLRLNVSVIDLGFNSIKLVNYHVNQDNSYQAYKQKRVNVQLGEALNRTGHLSLKSIQRTINSLKSFRNIINFQSIKNVLPVATSAVREANNQKEFLNEVYEETGFRFRVLSGKEEALYSYVGALRSTCIPTALFFDLGGGSLEIVYTENFKIKKLMSLPLGALRLSLAYRRNDGSFTTEKYDKMKQYILKSLPDKEGGLDMSPDTALVGVGGTLRAISRHYNEQQFGYYVLGKKHHNSRIDYESIDIIHRKLRKMKPKEIAKIDAIGINRANTITAGSCVVNMLMLKLGFGEIIASTSGLRDGILSSFLESPTYTSIDNNNINIDSDQIQNLLELFVDRRKGL